MPTYRYRCDKCGDEFEVWQSIKDPALTTHDTDGGELRKVLSAAGIVLKGSGFYKTDSRSGNGAKKSRSDDRGSKDKESSGKDKESSTKDSSGKDSSSSDSSNSSSDSKKSDSSTGSSS